MGRLIIIGNGYDLSRLGNATFYEKFRDWLCEKYNLCKDGGNEIPLFRCPSQYSLETFRAAGCDLSDEDKALILEGRKSFYAPVLVNMIHEIGNGGWCEFEKNLGNLPWRECIEKVDKQFLSIRSSDSSCLFGYGLIVSASSVFGKLFADWISEIECHPAGKQKFEIDLQNIEEDDTIIIFNYTDTFEQIFDLEIDDPRVLHIHGIAQKKDSIIVGHGDVQKSRGTNLDTVEDYIQDAEAALYKNADKIIEENKEYWEKIARDFSGDCCSKNKIYVYGWKGQEADKPYLKKFIEIANASKNRCQLFLSDYKGDGKTKKRTWKKGGFCGKITLFTDECLERRTKMQENEKTCFIEDATEETKEQVERFLKENPDNELEYYTWVSAWTLLSKLTDEMYESLKAYRDELRQILEPISKMNYEMDDCKRMLLQPLPDQTNKKIAELDARVVRNSELWKMVRELQAKRYKTNNEMGSEKK